VKDNSIRIGVDCRGDLTYAARVCYDGTRLQVKALVRLSRTHPEKHELLEDGEVVLAVPDDQVIVKRLVLPDEPAADRPERAKFEMSQALLEDERGFCFDTVNTGRQDRLLGLIMRRESLSKLVEQNTGGLFIERPSLSYRMRAVALGRGYVEFCRRQAGELVCLVDFHDQLASVCFVYQKHVLAVSHMRLNNPEGRQLADLPRLAVELKTLVNLQMSLLFSEGITVPLSSLIVTGEGVTEQVTEALARHFPGGVGTPQINTGFFADPSNLTEIPIDNYLISLGLTID